jgi:hypothetical protein
VRTCTSDNLPPKVNPTTEGCALHYIDVNWDRTRGYGAAPLQFLFVNKGRTRMGYGAARLAAREP